MSDTWMNLIPEEPGFVPEGEKQKAAEERLRQIAPEAQKISSATTGTIEFHDCGENFEAVWCPHCGADFTIDWWQDAMSKDHGKDGFRLERMTLPCCGQSATLHELECEGPQGFGKYVLETMNPGISELPENELKKLEKILGCRLRVIWRYL